MRLDIPAESYCPEGRSRFIVDSTCGHALVPPSTVSFAPSMYGDSGPATNRTSAATSPTCPCRSGGTAAFWPTVHSPSDRNHDLADLLVRLQVTVGLDDLLEGEGPGNDRLEAPVRQPLVHEALPPLHTGRVGCDLREDIPPDGDGFGYGLQHRHRRRLRA